jgi:hypothetical protein
VTAAGGNWTANFASAELPTDATTTVSAVASDVAGNVSVAGTKAVTFDTALAAPVVTAPDHDYPRLAQQALGFLRTKIQVIQVCSHEIISCTILAENAKI